MTRNAFKNIADSLTVGSDFLELEESSRNIVPPWCSSGRVYERRKPRKVPTRELKSSYPLRENIWEFLSDRPEYCRRKSKKCSKVTSKGGKRRKCLIFLGITGLSVLYLLCYENSAEDFVRRFLTKTKLISIMSQKPASVDEECCSRMRYLTGVLSRSEYALRNTLRIRRTMLISQTYGTATNRNAIGSYIAGASAAKGSDTGEWGSRVALWGLVPLVLIRQATNRNAVGSYIAGASAAKGRDTGEWGSRVALWGLVPLWRAAPPPDTILALRKPTPADCWPFSGSSGNIEIYLPRMSRVASISLEHIRPDTARSAPKDFIVYGILENGTWIKAADGIYRYNKPAKQYYSLDNRNAPLKRIVFRVLSNHGNPKYTCVYRVHLYSDGSKINDS